MALVEFEHVEKYYGDYHALRDINLRFEKGQVVVLLGPSGSGKSTLIRTINGLEAVDKDYRAKAYKEFANYMFENVPVVPTLFRKGTTGTVSNI